MHRRAPSKWKLLLLACLPLLATACGDGSNGGGVPSGTGSWEDTASENRSYVNSRFAYICPKEPDTVGPVWGTDVYTDDSSVCAAAVHAGKITFADGGNVIIEIRAGQHTYTGSTRNGVTSQDYSDWPGSFIFP